MSKVETLPPYNKSNVVINREMVAKRRDRTYEECMGLDMTPAQKEVFLVIDEWWKKYGFSPSIDDIMMVLGARGRGNIHRICNRLVEMGAVRQQKGKQRTLRPQGVKFRKIQT